MKKIVLNIKNFSYDILIDFNLIDNIGSIIKEYFESKRVFVITDSNVVRFHGEKIKNILDASNIKFSTYVLPAGEASKNIDTVNDIYNSLANSEITRHDIIIAFGGGVVGDIAGFVASTWMRGVRFIQVPTTVLACVDSSVGGKTGINISAGKNLVGSFYHPSLVLIDANMLKTLPDREFFSGVAEIVKHSLLFDSDMFKYLEENNKRLDIEKNICELLEKNCILKGRVVQRDFKELHERMMLNFGHTVGHSVEKHLGYGHFLHGEAVSIGIMFALKLGVKLGITKNESLIERVSSLLKLLNLPTDLPIGIDVLSAIKLDKKRMSNSINFIFIEDIEKPLIKEIDIEKIII